MSELNSLYVSINIKKANLKRFFQDKPLAAVIDQDWASWWDSREMYSPSPLSEVPIYRLATNREVFESLSIDPRGSGHEQQEKDEAGLNFSIVFFSENYFETLPMLAWLKSIALYLDAGEGGVALIYDFFWGGGAVMAHLVLSEQQALLKHTTDIADVDADIMAAANNTLQNAMDIISAQYGED